MRQRTFFLGGALLAVLAGCSDNPGSPAPNQLPSAEITSSVPAEGSSVVHHLEIHFSGRDADGVVVGFEYLLHTHPRSVARYEDIQILAPAADDPRWTSTAGQENPFFVDLVAPADTLRADPRGDIGEGRFDRWHTFFVRAVDNDGGKDARPDARTFDAYTVAPAVWLQDPAKLGPEVTQLPRSFVMRWSGVDDIGEGTTQDPVAVRWVLLEMCSPPCDPIDIQNALYGLPEESWSAWIPWAAADTLREARFLDLIAPATGESLFVFAVQGLDDAGAITPKFADSPLLANNYAALRVDSSLPVGPGLPVHEIEASLGDWVFDGDQAQVVQVAAAGVASVTLEWGPMQTLHYGGKGRDYRFGWNITNPADDGEWTAWSAVRSAPPHALGTGTQEFWLQARDHLGLRTTARLSFQN